MTHPRVPHYREFLDTERRWNDWAADHLVVAFGSVWTVWVFLVYPLLALVFPPDVQNIVFFISSGWIQLWALPLLNYTQNKADKVRTAKAEADHRALTHVALTADHADRMVTALAVRLGLDPVTGEDRKP